MLHIPVKRLFHLPRNKDLHRDQCLGYLHPTLVPSLSKPLKLFHLPMIPVGLNFSHLHHEERQFLHVYLNLIELRLLLG